MPVPHYYPDRDHDLAELDDRLFDFAEEAAKLAALVVVLPVVLFAIWAWSTGLLQP